MTPDRKWLFSASATPISKLQISQTWEAIGATVNLSSLEMPVD